MNLKFEVPKETQDKVYEVVETARASGKVKKGTNEVTKVIEKGTAKLVVIATDTQPPEVIMHLPGLSDDKKIPFVYVDSRKELGAAAGLEVPTASIAVIDAGEAKKTLQDLADQINDLRKKE